MSNFNIPYEFERDGQIEFFDNYGIPYDEDESILVEHTDGLYNGCILEFKLSISNPNKVLFQAIKYLSKMRIKGESVPATILLVDLNATSIYVYKSQDYFDDIHKVYFGAASKNTEGFVAGEYVKKLNYSDMVQSAEVKKILKDEKEISEMYMSINIDENCIVGWAERYYKEYPKATKGDFIGDETGTAIKMTGEIRNPKHFKGLINPYVGKTNEKFKYLMDCLNDNLKKKDLGAFYTPMPYCRKAAELVEKAVERVPEGNDYIILDRCAGTGNLEDALIGIKDKNGEELIEHCVVSTFEYYEYKVLQERIGDRVRDIIPPTEADVRYANGVVSNADAMSEEYINNPIIKKYIDDPKCTIILFENPPFTDSSSSTFNDGDKTKQYKTDRKEMFVTKEYIEDLAQLNERRNSSQELSNLFIWSGFKYYLRQPTDSFIVFSPVKYFKSIGLCKKHFVKGFAFNRQYFHASESVISCILWTNENEEKEKWKLDSFDITEDGELKKCPTITIKKCYKTLVENVEKVTDDNDITTTVACKSDGTPIVYDNPKGRQPVYNENIVGYLQINAFPVAAINRYLVRCNWKSGISKSQGFHLRKNNYKEMLCYFVAKLYPQDEWYEKDIYFTTSDGGDAFKNDDEFIKECLIYACLSNQNKCMSFEGFDDRMYQNELCFDKNSLASNDLKKMELNDDEKELLGIWKKVLAEAKKTDNYNKKLNYGVYHITKELNTFRDEGTGNNKTRIYDYPELNGYLDTLRTKLKSYYKKYITKKMFKYELLK